jgi:MFS family permease
VLVWLSFFSVMFGFYFVMSWTPKLLAASGLTPEQGVTTGVLLSLGGILGATLLGLLAARFAIHRALAVFMLVTAVLLCFLVGSSGALWMSYTLAFLIGVFVNACVAGLYAIAPVVYGSDVRATGVGWGIGIGRIGAIVSPLVAGGLLDAAWSPDQLYLGYGMAFVLAAVIVSMHRIAGPQARTGAPRPKQWPLIEQGDFDEPDFSHHERSRAGLSAGSMVCGGLCLGAQGPAGGAHLAGSAGGPVPHARWPRRGA